MAVRDALERWRTHRPAPAAAAALALAPLVVVFVWLGLVQASRDAPAFDEVVDLTAGVVAVDDGDLRMNPEHGVIPHVASAVLPMVLADPIVPRTAAYEDGDWFAYTEDLVAANVAAGRFDDVLFWYRVVPVLVGAATGVLLARLASRLGGPWIGFLAGALWLLSPYIVGVAHLSALDIWYAFALTLFALAAHRLLVRRGDGEVLAVGCAAGLALLVRHQAVVLVGVGMVLAVAVTGWRRKGAVRAGLVAVLPVVLAWSLFRAVDPEPVEGPAGQRFDQLVDVAASEGVLERLVVSLPLPIEWRAGAAYLVVTSEDRPAYLVGEYWTGGRPWYVGVSGLVKLPLTTTLLLALGAIGWWRLPGGRRELVTPLASAFGAELVLLHAQPLNLGLRLGVPLIAAACVVAAGSLRALPARAALPVVGVLLAGQAVALAASHPDSLAWTPPPFSAGYRYLSDSSIDLGQGNDAAQRRHAERPFVAATLSRPLGVDPLPGVPQVTDVPPEQLVGDVAVGATQLTVLAADELSWLRAYCPVEVMARSILVYRFDEPPDTTAGPSMPAAPCDGRVSTR